MTEGTSLGHGTCLKDKFVILAVYKWISFNATEFDPNLECTLDQTFTMSQILLFVIII